MAKNQTPSASATVKKEAFNRPLKTRNPNLYYGNSYMECYYFCQQCEDYFETAGAKGHRRVLFAVFFLKKKILFRWQQYENRIKRDSAVPPTWDEFKTFLRKSLGKSTTFVDSI